MKRRWEHLSRGEAIKGTEEEMKAFLSHIRYGRSYINPEYMVVRYKDTFLCEIEKVDQGWCVCNQGIIFKTAQDAVIGVIENKRWFKTGTLNGDRSVEWVRGEPELHEQQAKHAARIAFLERKGFLLDDLRTPGTTHDDESSHNGNETDAIASIH